MMFKLTQNTHGGIIAPGLCGADDQERQLIHCLCRGEVTAQSDLLVRYHGDIVTVVARMLGNSGDVQEVVQAIFVRVFSNLARYRGQVPLSIWLLRHAIAVVRLQRRKGRYRGANRTNDECVGFPNRPHDFQSQSPYSEALEYLMGQLNENLRTAFVLHEVLGFHANYIASILQTPAVIIKARLHFAKRKLVGYIANEPNLNSRLSELLGQGQSELPLATVGMDMSSMPQVPIHEARKPARDKGFGGSWHL